MCRAVLQMQILYHWSWAPYRNLLSAFWQVQLSIVGVTCCKEVSLMRGRDDTCLPISQNPIPDEELQGVGGYGKGRTSFLRDKLPYRLSGLQRSSLEGCVHYLRMTVQVTVHRLSTVTEEEIMNSGVGAQKELEEGGREEWSRCNPHMKFQKKKLRMKHHLGGFPTYLLSSCKG